MDRFWRVWHRLVWRIRRALAAGFDDSIFFYGLSGTIHGTGHVDVEIRDGEVVAVWFRCCLLPFKQHRVDPGRALDMAAPTKQNRDRIEFIGLRRG